MNEEIVFKQKFALDYKIFTLKKDVIRIKMKRGPYKWDYEVKYDELGFDEIKKVEDKGQLALLITGAVFISFFIGAFVATMETVHVWIYILNASIGLFFIFLGLIARKKYVYLSGSSKEIEFFENQPDAYALATFMDELKSRIRQAYKKQYLERRHHASFTMEGNAKWLYFLESSGIISEEEHATLFKEYVNLRTSGIGFNNRTNDKGDGA